MNSWLTCRLFVVVSSTVALAELNNQLNAVASKRGILQAGLDKLVDNEGADLQDITRRVRAKLAAVRERWESAVSPAELNALVSELVGPSLVSSDGSLLPMPTTNPVQPAGASVHGVVTPRGSDDDAKTRGKEGIRAEGGAECGAVIEAWPHLSDGARARILEIVSAEKAARRTV